GSCAEMATSCIGDATGDGPPSSRLTAAEIFAEGVRVGEDELKRSSAGLWFSGLAAGIAMGLSGLGSAAILAAVGSVRGAELLGALLYPLGFIVVIVGRAQLFTENTLFPVIVVLERRRHLLNTARLWGVVLCANIVGAVLFALLMITAGTLEPGIRNALEQLGSNAVGGSWMHLFWGGVAAGWIIALVAWVVSGSRFTIGQVALIWLLTFVVGAVHLPHCIAGSAEILCAVLAGPVGVGDYLYWLSAATIGNAVGGVVIVSVLNYAQVIGSGHDHVRERRDGDSDDA
ncbi:MAG: formate/nitrite transporter family protein, partial [Solirubrobacteraceae bacterium]